MNYKMPITVENYTQLNQEDKKQNKQKEVDDKRKQLENALINLKEKYDSYDSIKQLEKDAEQIYIKLDEDKTTDQELEKLVKDKVDYDYGEKKQNANDTALKKKEVLENQIEKVNFKENEDKKRIDGEYEKAKKNAENQALKRGLSRSSVIMNLIKDYDQNKFASMDNVSKKYEGEVKEIQSKIDDVSSELEKALKQLDMQSAIELNQTLEKLKKERDEKNTEIKKYNTVLNEKIDNYKKKLMSSYSWQQKDEQNKLTQREYANKMAYTILDYYQKNNIDSKQALEEIKSGAFDKYLDEPALKMLYNYAKNLG